jgi:hypothetical protein
LKLDITRTIFSGFTLISVIGVVVGLWLQWNSLELSRKRDEKEDQRRFKESAQQIISGWDKETSSAKSDIEGLLPRLPNPQKNYLPDMEPDTAVRIWFAKDNSKEEWTIKKDTTSLLNYFETVATAYKENYADPRLLRENLGGPMMDWRIHLRYYTALADCVRQHQVWGPYYKVVDQWLLDTKTNPQAPGRYASYVPLNSPACPGTGKEVEACCVGELKNLR